MVRSQQHVRVFDGRTGPSLSDLRRHLGKSATGGHARRLTKTREEDLEPSWSPDGRRIVFDRYDDGYHWIYVIDADGSGLRRITPNFNWSPVWMPDGRISYVNSNGVWT